jgi:excisionase family DNA binding protein
MNKPDGNHVTGAEAAQIKGVSRVAVYKAIREERIPAERHGRIWFIRRDDLDRWQPVGRRRRP